jgi:hypothetical protein
MLTESFRLFSGRKIFDFGDIKGRRGLASEFVLQLLILDVGFIRNNVIEGRTA